MNLKDLYEMCSLICDKHLAKNADACLTYKDQKIPYSMIKEELEKVRDWCYPLETRNIKKCTFCKDCIHYKSYTQASRAHIYMCSLDMKPKEKTHYCAYGEEKNEVQL